MHFFKAIILEKKEVNGLYTYSVQGQDTNDKKYYKMFSNFLVHKDIHDNIKEGETPAILILEYKDSPTPLAISFDGSFYYKSKNKKEHPKFFRLIKNEVHNVIDKKKNKNKILKSYFIPFYSRLLITPYYLLIASFCLMVINSIALYTPISNMECFAYTFLSTYVVSVVFIFIKVKHISHTFKSLQKWIRRSDNRRAA